MNDVLVPEVTAVVHPVDTDAHPTYGAGWRWAVMVGGAPPSDLSRCAGAWKEPTESEASVMAENTAAFLVKSLRMFGVPVRYSFLRLDYDPIPAEADEMPIGFWHDKPAGEVG